MPNRFASGKWAIATCDRCGQQYKLKELRKLTIKTQQVDIKVCGECYDPDQPQLQLGMYPVNDPQALREPRPDTSYLVSGIGPDGSPELGSRVFQWGWAPVGGARDDALGLTPNDLIANGQIGIVTVTTS
jgi:hypothetical protein